MNRLLWVVLLAYTFLTAGHVFGGALWEAPDEPSHFLYVQHFALHNEPQPPVLGLQGGWLQNVTRGYEWYQPPLYYRLASYLLQLNRRIELAPPFQEFPPVIATPTRVFSPTPFRLEEAHIIRLFSVAIGAATLLAIYRMACTALPCSPLAPLLAIGWVALIPQYQFLHAYITNDGLALWASSLTLWTLVTCVRRREQTPAVWFGVGILVGFGLAVKLINLFLLPTGLFALGLVAHYGDHRRPYLWRQAIAFLGGVAAPLLINEWLWPDLWFRLSHSPSSFQWERLNWRYYADLVPLTHSSFWGRFGRMNLPIPLAMQFLLDGVLLVGVSAFVYAWKRNKILRRPGDQAPFILLGTVILLVIAQFMAFNLADRQPQGRYLFPALPALAVFVAQGWISLAGREPHRQRWVTGALLGIMGVVSLYSLVGIVIPTYYGS